MARISLMAVLTAYLSATAADRGTINNATLQSQLAGTLSPTAALYMPSDADFANASARWTSYEAPEFRAYVEVATEQDVQQTIRFANQHDIPFLAMSGGHGWSSQLGKLQNGIGISTHKLKAMSMSDDGQSVRVAGGVLSGELAAYLQPQGKRSTTGVCECTGVLGVSLGGGHGILQGYYGLLADQILEARVVLADGSVVTASADENTDLFWALRGAGQNFGIVTEVLYRVYDAPAASEDAWTVKTMIYTPDQIPQVYTQINNFTDGGEAWYNQPQGLLMTSLYKLVDGLGDEPLLIFMLVFDGSQQELDVLAAPFASIGPLYNTTETVPYSSIPAIFGYDMASPLCQKGWRTQQFSLLMQKHDIAAQVEAYRVFRDLIVQQPEFNRTYLIFEAYSQQQVRHIPESSAAFAYRDRNIVTLFSGIYTHDMHDDAIRQTGQSLRSILHRATGAELDVYVGYANGDESVGQLYGRDPAKLLRLASLKHQYDPHNHFRFYAPLVERQCKA